MKRIYPRRLSDKLYLSRLLELYVQVLEHSPLAVNLKALSYNADIPECIFRRLMDLHRRPSDACNIEASDFHIVFSNIMFRYPTVKMYEEADGNIFFEM